MEVIIPAGVAALLAAAVAALIVALVRQRQKSITVKTRANTKHNDDNIALDLLNAAENRGITNHPILVSGNHNTAANKLTTAIALGPEYEEVGPLTQTSTLAEEHNTAANTTQHDDRLVSMDVLSAAAYKNANELEERQEGTATYEKLQSTAYVNVYAKLDVNEQPYTSVPIMIN